MQTATDTAKSIVRRTIWRIETDLGRATSLTDLALAEEVSPFHLTRAFNLTVGCPPMDYVKRRRLSEAARDLVRTDKSVTEIALAAGYETPEGFARAFRKMFSLAPSEARNASPPNLQEAIIMSTTTVSLRKPKVIDAPALKLVGVSRRYTPQERSRIPAQWEESIPRLAPHLDGVETFGVCHDIGEDSFSYLVGIEDTGHPDLDGLDRLTIPAARYAVFDHEGDVSELPATWEAIFATWLPASGETAATGPEFERYEPDFDPETKGGLAVWVPVKAS